MQNRLMGFAVLTAVLSMLLPGCGDGVSADVQQWRQKFLVDTAPTGETAIREIRAGLQSGELPPDSEVVVRVRINAGDLPPWERGKAAFIVTDAMGHEGDEDHDPHDCPFCSRDIQQSMAQVRFLNSDGVLISRDARELFDVQENQLVTIQGRVHLDESEALVIDASRMHPRR